MCICVGVVLGVCVCVCVATIVVAEQGAAVAAVVTKYILVLTCINW